MQWMPNLHQINRHSLSLYLRDMRTPWQSNNSCKAKETKPWFSCLRFALISITEYCMVQRALPFKPGALLVVTFFCANFSQISPCIIQMHKIYMSPRSNISVDREMPAVHMLRLVSTKGNSRVQKRRYLYIKKRVTDSKLPVVEVSCK